MMMRRVLLELGILVSVTALRAQEDFREILFVERDQYAPDHHNTETLFQAGEINP